MNVDEIYPSKTLKANDLQGRTVKVTIENFEVKKFENGNKIILSFTGKEKGMVINKTNADIIASTYGKDPNSWLGKQIEIYAHQTKMGPGLAVRVPAPPATDVDGDIPW